MAIERENAHRRSEAGACTRAAARRRGQANAAISAEFNIILIMRLISAAKCLVFQRPPLPFSAEILTFTPPFFAAAGCKSS
jgi:hypothetical protein